jgi:hypothetical protein
MLIVPLMRGKSIDPLVVYLREYKAVTGRSSSTSSITQQEASSMPETPNDVDHVIVGNGCRNGNGTVGSCGQEINSDPFVHLQDVLFDIRVKRLVDPSHAHNMTQHHQSTALFQDVAQPDNGHKFRVDSKDYSSLTEINVVLDGT